MTRKRIARSLACILAVACCAACSPPVEPPPDDRPPEPRATAQTGSPAGVQQMIVADMSAADIHRG